MRFTLESPDLDKLQRDAKAVGANTDRMMLKFFERAGDKIVSNSRDLAPHRTGTLQRSILPEIRSLTDAKVAVNAPYGKYFEYGTGVPVGHTKWRGKIPGVGWRWVAGMAARPFFKPGIERSLDFINIEARKVADQIIQQLKGKGVNL